MDTERIRNYLEEIVELAKTNEYTLLISVGFLAFLGAYALVYLVKVILISKLQQAAKYTESKLDDLVVNIVKSFGWPLYIAVATLVAVNLVDVNQGLITFLKTASMVVVSIYIIIALQQLIDYFVVRLVQNNEKGTSKQNPAVIRFMGTIGKVFLWVIGAIVIIQNLGYDVTALVGGLGVAGIAIAFAVQNVLEDLFSFVSIYFDKPFEVGDFIILSNGNMGTVEKVGVKSTRVRTLSGEELVVANTELTSAQLRNYHDLTKRRVEMFIGVVYGTPLKKLQRVNEIAKEAVEAQELAEFGRSHFAEFADSSLKFEIVFHVKTKEYKVYMDVLQEINLKIVEMFEKEKIEMAFPTQTIHLEK